MSYFTFLIHVNSLESSMCFTNTVLFNALVTVQGLSSHKGEWLLFWTVQIEKLCHHCNHFPNIKILSSTVLIEEVRITSVKCYMGSFLGTSS